MSNKIAKGLDSITLDDDMLSTVVTGGKVAERKAKVGRKKQHFEPQEVKLSVRISKDMHRLIQFAAYREKRPIVSVVHAALEEYLQRHVEAQKKVESP